MIELSKRVAIVGIGGVFPGAPDLERYWEIVASGVDATTEVPPGRWRLDPSTAFDPTVAAPDRVYSTRGGWIEELGPDPESGPDGVDLDRLDPMFRLALRAGRAAWRDARTDAVDRSRVGVVLGNIVLPTETTSALAWETLGRTLAEQALGADARSAEPFDSPTDPLNRFPAGLPAGLLARALGLGAGAYTLDAACASTLYALKIAADELLSGRADAMLTGGLSRPDPLYTQMGFGQLRALSAAGRARPFDGRGDGLVVGEGAGMFVLKRLDDALGHGDHIYGLVAAVGLSNDVDGGLLAPSSEGQLRAMRAAYERAGWDPRDVDLIECHATGTPVGDAVEFESLRALWGPTGWSPGRCVIGSHKANIGHLLTAAGAAGLVRVLLALRHRSLPPTANYETPGPKIAIAGSPFRVLGRLEEWPAAETGRPRRAAVSGFGFGGINAHALIEEWVPVANRPLRATVRRPPTEPAPLSVAIVGLGAHFGPFSGLRAVQERLLGGTPDVEPAPSGGDWGVGQSAWAREDGITPSNAGGFHLRSLALRLDRFRIPPRELEEMLPQQSLALLAAADAIDDAGWKRDRPRLRTGVFFGIGLDFNTTNFHIRWAVEERARAWNESLGLDLTDLERAEWANALKDAAGPPLSANRTMGALGGLIASRVAREFRLGGPSFTISSEETSGLHALEVAARLLALGELDEAVVGAVDLTGDPRNLIAADRAGVPPRVRGDGAAALVLKRLDDAKRDGDRVYAVVRGLGSASGGAIDTAELDPAVPASARRRAGTKSVSSERTELRILEGPERGSDSPTQSALGHTGAAAGLAGLVSGVLSLYQQVLPESARFWLHDRSEGPRLASVETISVGGGCVHVLLEEADRTADAPALAIERVQPLGATSPALFAIEADDPAGLLADLDRLDALLIRSESGLPVELLARRWFATARGGPRKRLGLALVAEDREGVATAVTEARRRVRGERPADLPPRRRETVHQTDRPVGRGSEVALVFPGIGNHFPAMGRDVSARWPEVFRDLERETLRLRSQMLPASGWEGPPDFVDHRAPIMAQVVLGTAMADLLRSFGIQPAAALGYSLGESSALLAMRAWTDRDAIHARLDASPLFRTELCGVCDAARRAWKLAPGTKVDWLAGIVPAAAADVRQALEAIERAYLLIINTPNECVVGGDRGSVLRLVERLGLSSLFVPLPVASTVHCSVAREVESDYRALHLLETTPPEGIRFYSAGWGRAYVPDRHQAAEAIVAQALDTVDFPAVVRRAYDDGVRIFLETGPGASCARMIGATLGDRPHLARSACVAGEDGVATVLHLLGRLIAERAPVDLAPLYGRETRAVGLAEASNVEARRPILVPVGGAPFEAPPRPPSRRAASPCAHAPLRTSPTLPEGPTPAMPTPTSLPPAPPIPSPVPSSDRLVAQLVATETARGSAHEAYLQVSAAIAQTLASHVSAQMGLVEALAATGGVMGSLAVASSPASSPHPLTTPTIEGRPRPILTREECLEFAIGSIGKALGPRFAAADAYPTRVRLPDEPLMLVDRITAIEGEALSMTSGRVVTEHDVSPGDWYLDYGKTPPCIAIESGQADLFLSGWLGIDFVTKGLAVYRLLDAAVTFHRGLPVAGEVIRYDIRISRFFRQGETHLFRFEFDGTIDGEPVMTMRDGCAGFFSAEELAAGKGIVRRSLDLRPLPGKRPSDWRPLVPMAVESYDDRQVEALRLGDYEAAFGPAFQGLGLRDPLRLPGGRLTLSHRVETLDPTGGRYGLGLIRSELDIHPGDWFLTCHFIDDQVMPGTLMYECCLHALRIYLLRMGWVAESTGVAYEPVLGVSSRLRCRGQVTESTRKAVFEVVVKELGYGPEPYAIADAMMFADGKAVVEVADMTLRLSGLTRESIEAIWASRKSSATPDARPRQLLNTREQVLAFARGRPSEAFGERFRPFDADRFLARLPSPPYSFLDRVVSASAPGLVMEAGIEAVGEYDVPPDAWYFRSERQPRMPFAVLLETPLQLCGWLSAYMGAALTSDEDLLYRNLGGEAVALVDVTPNIGTLTTRIKVTRVSSSAGMILHHYDMETRAGESLVYKGSTYFGFFRREALADQVGIREAQLYQPNPAERARGRAFDYPTHAPFPDSTLRMLDRVDLFVPDGGPNGLGFIAGSLAVKPESWYFEAHFYQDPVCPGSLGLESFLQLLKVVASERWGRGLAPDRIGFEPVALGAPHRWVYRGQVLPTDRRVSVQAVVTQLDDDSRTVTADGYLSVDGRVIYQMIGFSLRLLQGE